MYCTKCGKEIPEGEKKICEECEKKLLEEISAEEKNETLIEESIEEKNKIKEEKIKAKEEKRKAKEEKKKAKENEKKAKKDNKKSKDETKKDKKEKKSVEKNKEQSDKKTKGDSWNISEGEKCKKLRNKILIVVAILIFIFIFAFILTRANTVGNTIGNIRNYGYAAEQGGWIYYLSPNEDSSQIGIFKIRNNGKNKQLVYMSDMDIVSINVYKNHIYFLGVGTEAYTEDDELDNKIYRIKLDGSNLEILNDNEVNNNCYEIYVVDDSIYYIGLDAEICKMDLDGSNITVISDEGTGYLGITNEYIIYNTLETEESTDYVTYIMNRDGSNSRPILEGKRLYSVNIEDGYIYYTDADKKLYRTKLDSGEEELLYDNIEAYNLNTNKGYAYYLNYLDPNSEDVVVCVYRVKLDGTTETPENIKQLDSYSQFIDIVGNWVIYMDSNEEEGFINLVKVDGSGELIQLYLLDYSDYYEKIQDDYYDGSVDATAAE